MNRGDTCLRGNRIEVQHRLLNESLQLLSQIHRAFTIISMPRLQTCNLVCKQYSLFFHYEQISINESLY